MTLRAIQTPFPSNFANGHTPYHIYSGTKALVDHKGHKITVIATSADDALEKYTPTLYLSNHGECVCDQHLSNGGAYLQAEVENPNKSVSSRSTSDGLTTIQTALDNWLVITPKLAAEMPEEFEDIHCDTCGIPNQGETCNNEKSKEDCH